jgi:hypothetical protein
VTTVLVDSGAALASMNTVDDEKTTNTKITNGEDEHQSRSPRRGFVASSISHTKKASQLHR